MPDTQGLLNKVYDEANRALRILAPGGTYALAGVTAKERKKTGKWYTVQKAQQGSNVTLTDQRLYFVPLDIGATVTLDRIAIVIPTTVGSVGSVVRLGIYNDDGSNWPGTLLLDAGTVSSTVTGPIAVTISQALTAGRYWMAACGQGAPATAPVLYGVSSSAMDSSVGLLNAANAWAHSLYQSGVAGALPTPAAPTVDASSCPLIQIRAV